jgi:hypothetical protein
VLDVVKLCGDGYLEVHVEAQGPLSDVSAKKKNNLTKGDTSFAARQVEAKSGYGPMYHLEDYNYVCLSRNTKCRYGSMCPILSGIINIL